MKIGVLSDTHAVLIPEVVDFLNPCHQIWHAGDIGTIALYNQLSEWKPLKAVYGNIDGKDIRILCPEFLFFEVEGLTVLMTHIGGYPPKYNSFSLPLIKKYQPDVFVCGHSHILKVMYDKEKKMLAINPGSAGLSGFHKAVTAIRFDIVDNRPTNLEVFHKDR